VLRLSAIPGILNNTAELRNSSNLRRQPRQERVEVGLPHSLPIARSNQARPILLVPTPFALIILRCCPSLLSVPVTLYAVTPASFPRPNKLLSFQSPMADATALQMPSPETRRKKKRQKTEKKKKLPHIHVLLLRPTQFNVGYAQVFYIVSFHYKYYLLTCL